MLLKLVMPFVGRNIAGGSIVKWYKTEGEWVNPGDDLFDIQVDDGIKTMLIPLRPDRVLEGNKRRPLYGNRMRRIHDPLLHVTSSDMGFLRRIYPTQGEYLEVGDPVAILTTDEDEPFDEGGRRATDASEFRVVADIFPPA